MMDRVSVIRLGDLLDFGPLFKAFGNNSFAQISHILRQFFLVKSFLGNFYTHLAIFFWSHWIGHPLPSVSPSLPISLKAAHQIEVSSNDNNNNLWDFLISWVQQSCITFRL